MKLAPDLAKRVYSNYAITLSEPILFDDKFPPCDPNEPDGDREVSPKDYMAYQSKVASVEMQIGLMLNKHPKDLGHSMYDRGFFNCLCVVYEILTGSKTKMVSKNFIIKKEIVQEKS